MDKNVYIKTSLKLHDKKMKFDEFIKELEKLIKDNEYEDNGWFYYDIKDLLKRFKEKKD